MAMYITCTTEGKTTVYKHHIGQKIQLNSETVVEIQADCDELEFIKRNFTNIRMCTSRVVTFLNEDAKFIAHNLHRIRY